MNAEQYLRNIFRSRELDNAEIVSVEDAPLVVKDLQEGTS